MMAVLTVTVHLVHILSGYANKLALLDNFCICPYDMLNDLEVFHCDLQSMCSAGFL